MPLSWNEIKDRAMKFSREWADEASDGTALRFPDVAQALALRYPEIQ